MRVLLTRPEAQSKAFADSLPKRFDVVISPVIEPVFLDVNIDFSVFDAVVFTSQNGVAAYVNLNGPKGVRAYCVGAKTSEKAKQNGLDAVSADGDIRALNQMIAEQAGQARLLHLGGIHVSGRIDGNVKRVAAYDQREVALSAIALQMLAEAGPLAIPLFSARSANSFETQLDTPLKAELVAICISDNVAEALDGAKYACIERCDHPTAGSMRDKMCSIFPV